MTIREATYSLLNKIRAIYPESEASQITDWVMEHLTGSKKAERMIYKNSAITGKEEVQLQQMAKRLLKHEPVQYVLNEAWFCGLKFYVDSNVLIPRPETEELLEWVVGETRHALSVPRSEREIRILDIGTGSGCIPVALKKKLGNAEVWSCDVSNGALDVAKRNAAAHGVEINLMLLDFLDQEKRQSLPVFDIIISNPPYVPEKDGLQMQPNVINYEPHAALFVSDNDALVFYKAISEFGKGHLNSGGVMYVEIHEDHWEAVAALFKSFGYNTELKKDMQGKERMMKVFLN